MKNITEIPYSDELRDDHHGLPEQFEAILRERATPDSWCMDLGTGQGRVPFFLADKVRWVLGLDSRGEAIEDARQQAQNEGIVNVQFMIADVEKTMLAEMSPVGTFQLITSNLFFSSRALELCAPAIDDGGWLCSVCFAPDHWQETGSGTDHSFSEEELREMLAAHNLTIEEFGTETVRYQFESIDQVKDFLPERLLERWREDGRWRSLKNSFEKGTSTLTESKHIFAARH